jgi:AcrR family transcriptional regulator
MSDLVGELGLASARIYAAFGSKESLFREAIALYEHGEGGFAARGLAEEKTARAAIERIFREAIALYTRPNKPRGCMVVVAATNCSSENAEVGRWLSEHRRQRTNALIARFKRALGEGELAPGTDAAALGDCCATLLHGISVQARDGVSKHRLMRVIPLVLSLLDSK